MSAFSPLQIGSFYRGRKVFVTGHTGFKGSWLCHILAGMGAVTCGYSLEAPTEPSLFELSGVSSLENTTSVIGDIRDERKLVRTMQEFEPEVVIHLAAQPLVRESYREPALTYSTNVMGTVNILEAVRACQSVRSFLNVTTDKVYRNREWHWGYRESDELDGYDPYSNSKSCSELVTHSYAQSFFTERACGISTARAGNVIGGGDFSSDRIIPDCVRASLRGDRIVVRNPSSVRPYQHVLEPLFAYLLICEKQFLAQGSAGSYNIGPVDEGCVSTGDLVSMFCSAWGDGQAWVDGSEACAPHEASFLKLDCSKIRAKLGWTAQWSVLQAIGKTVAWTRAWANGRDVRVIMKEQIDDYVYGR